MRSLAFGVLDSVAAVPSRLPSDQLGISADESLIFKFLSCDKNRDVLPVSSVSRRHGSGFKQPSPTRVVAGRLFKINNLPSHVR